jgi:4-hydroxy-2-oxoheptanedioate aldolase
MHTKSNNIKTCLASGTPCFGTWVQMASPEVVEAAGYQGYDFVIIDMEHGHFDFDTAQAMIRAADAVGTTPVVRVAANEPYLILKALDMGAMAVLVPGIASREDAAKAVQAAKYPPAGSRGACPWTRATRYCTGDWAQHAARSNAETMIWLLVEGAEGIGHIDAILTVPDIDAIMMGPFDLSSSLGIAGQLDHPLLLAKLQELTAKTKARGVNMIAVMLSETRPEEIRAAVRKWTGLGCQIMTVGGDRAILTSGFRALLDHARQATR